MSRSLELGTQLRIEDLVMPAAHIGPENPLPPLRSRKDASKNIKVDENVPLEEAKYLGYGIDGAILPYRLQDQYDRDVRPRSFKVAVLENSVLRATFLLEYGGRLWSLFHKPTKRELLFRNPVFQPANLAVRNAWFSGGVEWNAGVRGHTPLTASPVFAARVEADDGTPVLRLYAWERIRAFPFQIDFILPSDSPWLYVRVKLRNPHDRQIPMYWWSNIAIPEREDVRVIVPADNAYRFGYSGLLKRVPIPVPNDFDVYIRDKP